MARRITLPNTLSLDPRGFKAGIRDALNALQGFRRDFLSVAGALGASFGIGGFVSAMKDTATQLSVARATLKNTSTGLGEFADNMRFVDGLSRKYKQDVLVLTDSFAKFHAACLGTNMSLEEQKELYQGLTQAATFFHMSSERTENMMIAVEQMMSKGKVTAEELRRQLGNNLPGAYARVAQAAIRMGKTVEGSAYAGIKSFSDFERAMKQGQIGVDVLLEFVRDLNKETKDFDTSSLQLAMNDLKNSWTEFVSSTDVENLLKNLYSMIGNFFNWLSKNVRNVTTAIAALVGGAVAKRVALFLANIGKLLKTASWANWVSAAITGLVAIAGHLGRVKKAINGVNDALGEIGKIEDKVQRYEALNNQIMEYDKFVQKNASKYLNTKDRAIWHRYQQAEEAKKSDPNIKTADILATRYPGVIEYYKKLEALTPMRKELAKIKEELIKENKLPNGNIVQNGNGGGGGGGKPSKEKTPKTYIEEYAEGVRKLRNQYQAGSKDLEEAQEDLDKLSITAWENITEFDNFREILAKLPEPLRQIGDELEGAFYAAKLRAKEEKEAKDREKRQKALNSAMEEFDEFKLGASKGRNTRFDYRKSASDIAGEEADWWSGKADDLKKLQKQFKALGEDGKEALEEINALLEKAQEQATSWKEAADIAEWREELEKLQQDYNKGLTSGLIGFAQDVESIARGWKQVSKTLKEGSDASELDKFVAVFNEIIQSLQTVIGLVETVNKLTEVSEALTNAKNAAELAGLEATLDKEGLITSAKMAEVVASKASATASEEEAAAALTAAGAKSQEAVAGAAKSGAGLPFPYNLIAIGTGVAAVIGALATVKKFANGGVVKGSRHGDRNLAALNGGEMVLNTNQQARLFNLLNGKSSLPASGGELTFKVRGSDLITVLNNERSKRRG